MTPFKPSDLPPRLQAQLSQSQLSGGDFGKFQPRIPVDVSGISLKPSPEHGFTLPYPPSVNTYWRSLVIGGRLRVVLSKKGREYKQAVQRMGHKWPLDARQGPIKVELRFYRPRKIGDLDNGLKAVLDALKGMAFEDDGQIEEIHAMRFDDKANPRVHVIVTSLIKG